MKLMALIRNKHTYAYIGNECFAQVCRVAVLCPCISRGDLNPRHFIFPHFPRGIPIYPPFARFTILPRDATYLHTSYPAQTNAVHVCSVNRPRQDKIGCACMCRAGASEEC